MRWPTHGTRNAAIVEALTCPPSDAAEPGRSPCSSTADRPAAQGEADAPHEADGRPRRGVDRALRRRTPRAGAARRRAAPAPRARGGVLRAAPLDARRRRIGSPRRPRRRRLGGAGAHRAQRIDRHARCASTSACDNSPQLGAASSRAPMCLPIARAASPRARARRRAPAGWRPRCAASCDRRPDPTGRSRAPPTPRAQRRLRRTAGAGGAS